MQRLGGEQHHVVGDVDDVVDRPLAGCGQPRLQPGGRGADRDLVEDPRGEPRAEIGYLDGDRGAVGHIPLTRGHRVLGPGLGSERGGGHGVDLACDPVDAEAVDPVGGHLELEHRLGQGQDLGQRGARRRAVVEDEDPVGLLAELELGRREDHPFGGDAAQFRLAQLLAARHAGAGQRHGDGLARVDVGRAADDRARLPVAGVDRADAEPVRVGVLLAAEHAADDEAVPRGRADRRHPLDLGPGHRQPLGELAGVDPGVAVLAQPRVRDPHENCPSTRASLSKKRRRSGTPWRSIAIRSTPIPKAKPCTRSGS